MLREEIQKLVDEGLLYAQDNVVMFLGSSVVATGIKPTPTNGEDIDLTLGYDDNGFSVDRSELTGLAANKVFEAVREACLEMNLNELADRFPKVCGFKSDTNRPEGFAYSIDNNVRTGGWMGQFIPGGGRGRRAPRPYRILERDGNGHAKPADQSLTPFPEYGVCYGKDAPDPIDAAVSIIEIEHQTSLITSDQRSQLLSVAFGAE